MSFCVGDRVVFIAEKDPDGNGAIKTGMTGTIVSLSPPSRHDNVGVRFDEPMGGHTLENNADGFGSLCESGFGWWLPLWCLDSCQDESDDVADDETLAAFLN